MPLIHDSCVLPAASHEATAFSRNPTLSVYYEQISLEQLGMVAGFSVRPLQNMHTTRVNTHTHGNGNGKRKNNLSSLTGVEELQKCA